MSSGSLTQWTQELVASLLQGLEFSITIFVCVHYVYCSLDLNTACS